MSTNLQTSQNLYKQAGVSADQLTRRARRANGRIQDAMKRANDGHRSAITKTEAPGPHEVLLHHEGKGYGLDSHVNFIGGGLSGCVDSYWLQLPPADVLALSLRMEAEADRYEAAVERYVDDTNRENAAALTAAQALLGDLVSADETPAEPAKAEHPVKAAKKLIAEYWYERTRGCPDMRVTPSLFVEEHQLQFDGGDGDGVECCESADMSDRAARRVVEEWEDIERRIDRAEADAEAKEREEREEWEEMLAKVRELTAR